MRSAHPGFASVLGLGALGVVSLSAPAVAAASTTCDTPSACATFVTAVTSLAPYAQGYRALGPGARDAFTVRHRLRDRWGEPARAAFHLGGPEGAVLAQFDATGWLENEDALLASPAFTDTHAAWTTHPDTPLTIEAVLAPRGQGQLAWAVADLAEALRQGEAFLRAEKGVMMLAAPGLNAVQFTFDGPVPRAEIRFGDGQRVPLPVAYDTAWFVPGQWPGAVAVEFSSAPSLAALTYRGVL